MEFVFIGLIFVVLLLFILIMILRVVNYFLKSDKSDRVQKKKNAKKETTIDDRLESLRELAGGLGPDSRYRRLDQADLKLPNKIGRRAEVYESVDDNSTFLILPTSYVVTRSVEEAAPLLKMVAALDAEDPKENKVIFKFTVAPNLLPYHMAYLQSAVKAYFDSQSSSRKKDKDPDIFLPTDISEAPEVIWENAFTHLDSFTTEGAFMIIWIQAKSVTEAAAAAKLLQPDPTHQGLHGKVRFPLDEKQTVQSPLLVNLDNVVGEAISIESNGEGTERSVSIQNRTESLVQIQHIMIFNKDVSEFDIRKIDPPEIIHPGNRCSMTVPNHTGEVLVDYLVKVSQEKYLSELRVDVGELNLFLAVDTDIQPHETFQVDSDREAEPLSAIRTTINWDIKAPKTITLTPDEENGEVFSRETIPLIVPLDRYLGPEGRVLQYKATFQFENGTQLVTEPLRHNYSDTRLTIRRQILNDLLTEGKGEKSN